MDLGLDFDNDFFEEPDVKKLDCSPNYEAKVYKPLWFMEGDTVKSDDPVTVLKHQADYQYVSKHYAEAAELYERCLELVPVSNNTWRREFMENLARCHLHLEQPEKALEWSLKLDESSVNSDQKVISMNLLATVCHSLGKFEEELEALHCCIEAHKTCPEFWQRIGLCYAGLFKINLPDYFTSIPVDSETSESCCDFNSSHSSSRRKKPNLVSSVESAKNCEGSTNVPVPSPSVLSSEVPDFKCELCTLGTHIVSSCLIHTRMLIDSEGENPLSFEKNKQIKEKIANSLKQMQVEQSFIDVASQMLGTDFLAGLQRHGDLLEQHSSDLHPTNSLV